MRAWIRENARELFIVMMFAVAFAWGMIDWYMTPNSDGGHTAAAIERQEQERIHALEMEKAYERSY